MKKMLMLGSATVAMAAVSAPTLALDVDFSGRSRFTASGGESVNVTLFNAAPPTAAGQPTGLIVTPGLFFFTAPFAVAPASVGTLALVAGTGDADLSFSNDERLDVSISAQTCCLSYGGKLRIEDGGVSSNIYMKGDWGQLDFGNIENARSGAYDTSTGSAGPLNPGTSALAIDVVSTAGTGSTLGGFDGSPVGSPSIRYTAPTMGGFVFKAATDGDDTEFGVAGSLGPVGLKASTDSNGRYGVVATSALGGFDLAAWTGEDDDGESYMGGSVAKSMGALNLSLAYGEAEGSDTILGPIGYTATRTELVGGVSYQIASGLKASASVRGTDVDASILAGGALFADASFSAVDYAARLQLDF